MTREEILAMLDGMTTADLIALRDVILATLRNLVSDEAHPPGEDQSDG